MSRRVLIPHVGDYVAHLIEQLAQHADRSPWYLYVRTPRGKTSHHPEWKSRSYHVILERIVCRALDQKVIDIKGDIWAEGAARIHLRANALGRAVLAHRALRGKSEPKEVTYAVVIGGPGQPTSFGPAAGGGGNGANGAQPLPTFAKTVMTRPHAGAWVAPPSVTAVKVIGFGGGGGGGAGPTPGGPAGTGKATP